MKELNEKLKGWRGILLSWISVATVFLTGLVEGLQGLIPILDQVLGSEGIGAALVALAMSAKLYKTDVGKK